MMFRNTSPLFRARIYVENNASVLADKCKKISEPIVKKCEGTVLGRAGTFLKNVATDYNEVFVETYNDFKANPSKLAVYMGAFGLGTCCVALNPDEVSYRDALTRNELRVMMLPQSTRNPLPENRMIELEKYFNEGRMRRFNLGLMSVMWIDDHDKGTALYDTQCDFLKPSLDSYPSRIIDIGFLGKWWLLSRCMKDYDVNPEEFN